MGIVVLLKTAPPVTIPFKEQGRAVLLLGGLGTPMRRASAEHNTRKWF
jgi:hypothetical protein